ncbi:unnamed protein product, partial [Ectocarpus sp. 12 AP-2014]
QELLPLVRPLAPQQDNGSDCGMYALRYAKEICKKWPMVTGADVDDNMRQHCSPDLFSLLEIVHDRRVFRNLLQNCK